MACGELVWVVVGILTITTIITTIIIATTTMSTHIVVLFLVG
jgi:hypothetical protein